MALREEGVGILWALREGGMAEQQQAQWVRGEG